MGERLTEYERIALAMEEGEKQKKEFEIKYDKFLTIVKEELSNLVGDFDELSIKCDMRGITILIHRSNCLTFYIEDDCFLVGPIYSRQGKIKISSLETFREVVIQLINDEFIPTIYDLYKKTTYNEDGHQIPFIKTLPSKLVKKDNKLDFNLITKEWLTEKFYEISSDVMNGEYIENVLSQKLKDGLFITFDVNCGRYGLYRNHSISIGNRGEIKIDLFDTPVEGCGIESGLEEEIEKLLDIK